MQWKTTLLEKIFIFSRLKHALSEKESAQQERDDMEMKLNSLTQQKFVDDDFDYI